MSLNDLPAYSREAVLKQLPNRLAWPLSLGPRRNLKRVPKHIRRLVEIPKVYLEALPIGEKLFPPLYQFENGLRLAIHGFLSTLYTPDW